MKVAIIDSGIPLKSTRKGIGLSIQENFEIKVNNEYVHDENGHGSKVYEIIEKYLGEEDEIFSIKILDEHLRGHSLCLIKAIEKATEEKCNVINISLGTLNVEYIVELENVIKKAMSQGIKVVAANNNDGHCSYPANLREVYGVFTGNSENTFDCENNNFYIKNEQIFNSEILIGNSYIAPHISGLILNILRKNDEISGFRILNEIKERGLF